VFVRMLLAAAFVPGHTLHLAFPAYVVDDS